MRRFTNINAEDILETLRMIHDENLDVRTVTMGISLWIALIPTRTRLAIRFMKKSCAMPKTWCLSPTASQPSMASRSSTSAYRSRPIAMLLGCAPDADPVCYAKALDRAADTVGINFIGGYSALVHKVSRRVMCGFCSPFRKRSARRKRFVPASISAPRNPASTWMLLP